MGFGVLKPNIEKSKIDYCCFISMNTKTIESSKYTIGKDNRRAIIFYNANGDKEFEARENDSKNLKCMLEELNFEVTTHSNLTKASLFHQLKEFCDGSGEPSCLFVFLLTHGTEDKLMALNDSWYEISDLLTTVSTDKNADIPKIVFIDACRGAEYDRGFEVAIDTVDSSCCKQLQQFANLMVACSSTPVYRAYLNEHFNGTKYNECICKMLLESSGTQTNDLMSMLTKVNYQVGYMNHRAMSAKEDREAFNAKQMPFIMSTFKTKLYLSPTSNIQQERVVLETFESHPNARVQIKRENRDVYNMDYGIKGLAVILHDRETEVNCKEYEELFNTLGFTVKSYEIEIDLKRALEHVGDEYGKENPELYSCFVYCIVAKYQREQAPIHIPPYWKDDLNKFFTNDEFTFFAGKPKIFIMHLDENETQSVADGGDVTDGGGAGLIPRTADMLIYSVKENISQQSPTAAAKEIIAKLKSADQTEDLVTTLTKASHCIKDKTPTIFSTLTGKVFLK